MLTALSIRNIVLIDKLDLAFGPGLSVLTGETGAGKSILLDAFALALGGRGDASLVRSGESQGQVTAVFEPDAGSSRAGAAGRKRRRGRRRADSAAQPVPGRPHQGVHQRRARQRAASAQGGRRAGGDPWPARRPRPDGPGRPSPASRRLWRSSRRGRIGPRAVEPLARRRSRRWPGRPAPWRRPAPTPTSSAIRWRSWRRSIRSPTRKKPWPSAVR